MKSLLYYLADRFQTMVDYAVITIFIACACLLVIPAWKENVGYVLAAVLSGMVVGWGVEQTESYYQWRFLASALATVMAPASIIALQSAAGILPARYVKAFNVLKGKE